MNKKELLVKWLELTGCVFAEGEIPTNKVLKNMIDEKEAEIEASGDSGKDGDEYVVCNDPVCEGDKAVDDLIDEKKKTKKVASNEKSEDLPKNLKVLNKKNGFFIETIGQGWVKLSKGQLLRLVEIVNG